MKAIIQCYTSQECERIVRGEQTVKVCKTAPKETPFKVYIYCTKKKPNMVSKIIDGCFTIYNGYIIGEFICDKVEDIYPEYGYLDACCEGGDYYILDKCCLSRKELIDYGKSSKKSYPMLYGLHISELKIYDEPKELGKFSKYGYKYLGGCCVNHNCKNYVCNGYYQPPECKIDGCFFKRPPSSWCYVEESVK